MTNVKIPIRTETRDELKKYGNKDSSWDEIVVGLMNHACKCGVYWDSKEWKLLK